MNNNTFFFFYNLAHQSEFFDKIIIFLAVYFIYIVIILAFIFLFFYHKNFKEFVLLCVSGGLAWALAKILKILIHTERPLDALSGIQTLFLETGYAFPSGHTAVAAAIAFSIFFINKKAGYVFILLALLIGLSRVVAGVHFPVDILGGLILGAGISYLVAYFGKNV